MQTDVHTGRQTSMHAVIQAGSQTGKQTSRQPSRPENRHTGRKSSQQVIIQTGSHTLSQSVIVYFAEHTPLTNLKTSWTDGKHLAMPNLPTGF